MKTKDANLPESRLKRTARIRTDLAATAVTEISAALRPLLDEQADPIFAMTDDIAERARKLGGATLRSMRDISRHQRLKDNNDESLTPQEMPAELCADNLQLTRSLRSTHEQCDQHSDVATASLIEVWIDQTERRTWFLSGIKEDL